MGFTISLSRFSRLDGNSFEARPEPYLEVHCKYNLLSNCSYNPTISRVTVVKGLLFRL